MVSKNNLQHKLRAEAKRRPHYGLRKLSVGVASVLLSTSFYLGMTNVAHADTVAPAGADGAPQQAATGGNAVTQTTTQTTPAKEAPSTSTPAPTTVAAATTPAPTTPAPAPIPAGANPDAQPVQPEKAQAELTVTPGLKATGNGNYEATTTLANPDRAGLANTWFGVNVPGKGDGRSQFDTHLTGPAQVTSGQTDAKDQVGVFYGTKAINFADWPNDVDYAALDDLNLVNGKTLGANTDWSQYKSLMVLPGAKDDDGTGTPWSMQADPEAYLATKPDMANLTVKMHLTDPQAKEHAGQAIYSSAGVMSHQVTAGNLNDPLDGPLSADVVIGDVVPVTTDRAVKVVAPTVLMTVPSTATSPTTENPGTPSLSEGAVNKLIGEPSNPVPTATAVANAVTKDATVTVHWQYATVDELKDENAYNNGYTTTVPADLVGKPAAPDTVLHLTGTQQADGTWQMGPLTSTGTPMSLTAPTVAPNLQDVDDGPLHNAVITQVTGTANVLRTAGPTFKPGDTPLLAKVNYDLRFPQEPGKLAAMETNQDVTMLVARRYNNVRVQYVDAAGQALGDNANDQIVYANNQATPLTLDALPTGYHVAAELANLTATAAQDADNITHVSLTTSGGDAVKVKWDDANTRYLVTVSVVKDAVPATATITYHDDTTNTDLKTDTANGHVGEAINFATTPTAQIKTYTDAGYVLVSDGFTGQNYVAGANAFTVHLKHGVKELAPETKTVTRHIQVEDRGTTDQRATFSRTVATDLVTNKTVYGQWNDDQTWPAFTVPQIPGATAYDLNNGNPNSDNVTEIPAVKVTPEMKDKFALIFYNYHLRNIPVFFVNDDIKNIKDVANNDKYSFFVESAFDDSGNSNVFWASFPLSLPIGQKVTTLDLSQDSSAAWGLRNKFLATSNVSDIQNAKTVDAMHYAQLSASLTYIYDTHAELLDGNFEYVRTEYSNPVVQAYQEINQNVDNPYSDPSNVDKIEANYDKDPNKIIIHYRDKTTSLPADTKNVTRTINITNPDGTVKTINQTVHFTRTNTKDLVTEAVSQGPWVAERGFDAFAVPTVLGFTPSVATIPAVAPTEVQGDQTVKVTYTANPANVRVVFVDAKGQPVGTPQTVTGVVDGTVDLTKVTLPTGWAVSGADLRTDHYTLGVENADIKQSVQHGTKTLPDDTKDVTRTIEVTQPDGKTATVTQTAHFTRTSTEDLVDHTVTHGDWSADQQWPAYEGPAIANTSAPQVPEQVVAPGTPNVTVKVSYQNLIGTTTVSYVDGLTGKVVATETVTGKLGDQMPLTKVADLTKAGYQVLTPTVTINAQTSTQKVTLAHQVLPASQTVTVTRTIQFVGPDGKALTKPVVQTVAFNQTGTKDGVTGVTKWHDELPQEFASVKVPSVPGYTASLAMVPTMEVTPLTDAPMVMVKYTKDQPQPAPKPAPVKATATLAYVDDTTGKTIQTVTAAGTVGEPIKFATDPTTTIKQLTAAGYVLVTNDFKNQTFKQGANTFTVNVKHGEKAVTDHGGAMRIIDYVDAQTGAKITSGVIEHVELTRKGTQDLVTKEITWGPMPTAQFDAVGSPTVPGYEKPDQATVPAQMADLNTEQVEVKVKYQAIAPIGGELTVKQDAKLTNGDAKDAIVNHDQLPTGTTYTWLTSPNTKEAGTQTGTVLVKTPGQVDQAVTVLTGVLPAAPETAPEAPTPAKEAPAKAPAKTAAVPAKPAATVAVPAAKATRLGASTPTAPERQAELPQTGNASTRGALAIGFASLTAMLTMLGLRKKHEGRD